MTLAADLRCGKSHRDENFPVASRLIPAAPPQPILAFYDFVRTADDIADHATLRRPKSSAARQAGSDAARPKRRRAGGVALRSALAERGARPAACAGPARRVPPRRHQAALRDWDELMNYCRYSAMPVGRFVLDVHGEPQATWPANDALCAALQIINHLQDCADDYRDLDRVYMPLDLLARHGARVEDLKRPRASPALRACLRRLAARARRPAAAKAPVFRGQIADRGLAWRSRSIQRLAERLTRTLRDHDPLSERVHLGKLEVAGARVARHRAGASRRFARSRNMRTRAGGRRTARANAARHRLGQLVLRGHAHPAARAARRDVRRLRLLPRGGRHRRRGRRPRRAARALAQWRRDIDALYDGDAAAPTSPAWRRRCAPSASRARISSPSSTAWRWTCAPTSARPTWRRSISIATASPAPSGGCSVRIFGMDGAGRHRAGASSRPRVAAHQYPARPRRGRRASAGSICRASCWSRQASPHRRAAGGAGQPRARRAPAPRSPRAPPSISHKADAIMARSTARRGARAAHHGRSLSPHPAPADRARLGAAARAGQARQGPDRADPDPQLRRRDGPHGPRHRRRPCGTLRRHAPCARPATASSCTRPARRPAAVAAPITTPRSA